MFQELKGSETYFFRTNSIVTASDQTIYLPNFVTYDKEPEIRQPDSSVDSGEKVISRSEQVRDAEGSGHAYFQCTIFPSIQREQK
jgi:hypothetical protein